MNPNVISIQIITNKNSGDYCILHCALPDAGWPYKENSLALTFHAAQGTGKAYCEKHFPNIKINVVTD